MALLILHPPFMNPPFSPTKQKVGGGNKRIKPGGDGGKGGGFAAAPVVVLKRSSRWACVKNCGACCYLAPEERPDLAGE